MVSTHAGDITCEVAQATEMGAHALDIGKTISVRRPLHSDEVMGYQNGEELYPCILGITFREMHG